MEVLTVVSVIGLHNSNVPATSSLPREHSCTVYSDCLQCVSDPCSRTDPWNETGCIWCDTSLLEFSPNWSCVSSTSSRDCDPSRTVRNTKQCQSHRTALSSEMTSSSTGIYNIINANNYPLRNTMALLFLIQELLVERSSNQRMLSISH